MAMVSMKLSIPPLNFPNLRPNKRYPGMAFAATNQDAVALGVKVTQGEGNLPKLVLTSAHGSEAEIYLFGGCITSWKVPSGRDLLFVRPDAVFDKKKPIRGIRERFERLQNPILRIHPIEGREERDAIAFPGFVDCIYLDAPNEVHLDNALGDVITIKNTK